MEVRRHQTTLEAAMRDGRWQGEVVRLSRGVGLDRVSSVSTASLSLTHVRFPHEATVLTQQPKGFVTFTLPLTRGRKLRVNGTARPDHGLFVNFGCRETQIFGHGRDHIAGRIKTERLLSALSQITGSALQEAAVPRGAVGLARSIHERLVHGLLVEIYAQPAKAEAATVFEERIVHIFACALISAHQLNDGAAKALQIVNQARRALDLSKNKQPTLTEICDAAGFSAPVVTNAFQCVTGASPARYARLARLARAHSELCKGNPMTASVKEVALEMGFRELGRFSGLYRQVYGRLPAQALGSVG